jgi:ribosomal protein S18 acetylase RimI-like enzyme
MNQIVTTSSVVMVSLPAPRVEIAIRVASTSDLPFLDSLQKQHSRQLGYFPTKQFEGYIEMGGVSIAESNGTPVGYCISRDRYLKRDELGVIYQLCVVPGDQRKLVGASLIREVFARSAYGCRLYCCWCAQDLAANYFWESLGFVPVAFRAGSTGKKRVHIFWQKRICEGDETTPYWYPFQTNSGAIREDRLVFPIPPGVHWKDVQAVEVPKEEAAAVAGQLPDAGAKRSAPRSKKPAVKPEPVMHVVAMGVQPISRATALRFVVPEPEKPAAEKNPRKKKPAAKIDPKYLAAARELRDRYMEKINSDPRALLSSGKYDVARQLAGPGAEMRRLPEAA